MLKFGHSSEVWLGYSVDLCMMRKLRAEVQVLFVHQIPDPQRPELTIQSSWQQYFQSGIVSDATVVPLTSYHSDRSATPFLHVLGVTTVSLQYQDSASSVSEHVMFPHLE